MKNPINEGNTAYLTVTFKNKLGVAEAPTSASYAIRGMHTGNEIRASTALTPAASIEITLTPADTTIQDSNHAEEIRRVTVLGGYGGGQQVVGQFDFTVVNLSGV